MCSQFLIKTRLEDLKRNFGIVVPSDFDFGEPERLISPYQKAPVLAQSSKQILMPRLMNFSLIPSWSKEKRVKFASHNARIETVAEKPTWKKPFLNKHAVVPLKGFVEPIYVQELAGNMVEFFDSQNATLYAAAIWDEWVDKANGELIESFAILTGDPLPFVERTGHDRSPIFLKAEAVRDWVFSSPEKAHEHLKFLTEHRFVPSLDCRAFRPLKAGWEKRVKV